MKCFEIKFRQVLPGINVKQSGNQTFVALADNLNYPGRKIFLTNGLVDQMHADRDLTGFRKGELILQGDGSYWLGPEDRQSHSALVCFKDRTDWPGGALKVGLSNDRFSVVSESSATSRADNAGTTYTAQGFLAVMAAGEKLDVKHLISYRVPGSGFSLCRPLNTAQYQNHITPFCTIGFDGTSITLSQD